MINAILGAPLTCVEFWDCEKKYNFQLDGLQQRLRSAATRARLGTKEALQCTVYSLCVSYNKSGITNRLVGTTPWRWSWMAGCVTIGRQRHGRPGDWTGTFVEPQPATALLFLSSARTSDWAQQPRSGYF